MVINVACEPRDSPVAEAPGAALALTKDNTAKVSAAKLNRLGMSCTQAQARAVFSWPVGPVTERLATERSARESPPGAGFGNFTA